jgi:hypothetical protein
MDHVWHTIEYCGNTLIFLLAGLITGRHWYTSNEIEWMDTMRVLLMFVCMTAIRGLMMLLFYPALSRLGFGTNMRDVLFMTWGGLRGAVGLALVLVLKRALDNKCECCGLDGQEEGGDMRNCSVTCSPEGQCVSVEGTRVSMMVSALAALTLVVNGVSSGALLRCLGMVGDSSAKTAVLEKLRNDIAKKLRTEAGQQASDEKVASCVSIMKIRASSIGALGRTFSMESTNKLANVAGDELKAVLREVFLEVLLHQYWVSGFPCSLPVCQLNLIQIILGVVHPLTCISRTLHLFAQPPGTN